MYNYKIMFNTYSLLTIYLGRRYFNFSNYWSLTYLVSFVQVSFTLIFNHMDGIYCSSIPS